MTEPFKFEIKAKYLNWRLHWRREYFELSDQIRGHKARLREAQRKHEANCTDFQNVWYAKLEARKMMQQLEKAKAFVRERLRELGIPAPDPMKRIPPPPRLKHRWTPNHIAEARYCFEVKGADGHSD